MRRSLMAMILLGTAVGATGQASAGVVMYTDRASFEAAAAGLNLGLNTLDFEGLAPVDGFTPFSSPPGLQLEGMTFLSATDTLFVVDPGFDFPKFVWDSGQYLMDNTFEPDPELRGLSALLPSGTLAVGTDISSFGLGEITVELASGDTFFVESPGQPVFTFVGFTSDIPIAGLLFNKPGDFDPDTGEWIPGTGDAVVLDNFTIGTASVVPEPSTFSLAGIGVLGLVGAARRRRRA